jgi:hypothetical protein
MRRALLACAVGLVACGRPPASSVGPARPAVPPASLAEHDRAAEHKLVAFAAPIRAAFVGEGSLEAHGDKTGKTKLALQRLAVKAESAGDVAEVTVEHVFRNDADERLEGTFRFPLPEGAMLLGIALEIDGKLVEGTLVERDKARKAYEDTVDAMRDPALLEWEGGTTFKLRVFPIDPKATKRVVLRLVAPLHRAADGLYFAFRPPSADVGLSLEKLSVVVDGKDVTSAARSPSGDVLARVADSAPEAVVERTKDGEFLVANVRPAFDAVAAPPPVRPKGQALVVLCDRSRSMLEARALEAHVLAAMLGALETSDRFAVVAGDVRARAMPAPEGRSVLHEATEAERAAAAAFLDAAEPDGASDLGALIDAAAAAGAEARAKGLDPVFAYVGDATATWGETRASEVARIAGEKLGGGPVHVVLLGKSTDASMARELSSATHGRLIRPKTEVDAARAAELILSARTTRRLDDVKLVADDGVDVPLAPPGTVYEGDEISVAAFVPHAKSEKARAIKVVGTIAGQPYEKTIAIASAASARDVAVRWAKARIEALERDGDAHKDAIVQTSLAYGVMSRYTSLLVLESDEAYAKFQIERKAQNDEPAEAPQARKRTGPNAEEARVTGRDLDADSDGRTASVTPDHLQPGDPEIRVFAPTDAHVVVVLPFGETKAATWEDEPSGGCWVARFLVDAHTPDGTYDIVVRVTYADGRVELRTVPYVVDTQQPNLDVRVVAKPGGKYEILAKQRLTAEEVAAQAPEPTGTRATRSARLAQVLTDAKRVEVVTPDGQTLSLVHRKLGEFAGTWTPVAPVAPHAKLRVVAVDRALNERATEVEVP